MQRLAVLASHEGTTLQAVLDACGDGTLDACVSLVISNNSQSGAIRRAMEVEVNTLHLSNRTHRDDDARDAAMLQALNAAKTDWVLLLGYMKKMGPQVLKTYEGRILNTHPALLPKFGGHGFFGHHVHQAVLDAGETESGATIHLVDADYDTGPLLSQVKVPVKDKDTVETLQERVKAAEQKLLVNTLMELINKRQASNY